MKTVLIFFTILLGIQSSFADSRPDKIWTSRKTGKSSYNFCPGAKGYCDTSAMETNLMVKCYEAGYPICTTIFRSSEDSDSGSNVVCGEWRSNRCIVQVKGSFRL